MLEIQQDNNVPSTNGRQIKGYNPVVPILRGHCTLLVPKHSTRRSNATFKRYEPLHVADQIHHADADAGARRLIGVDKFMTPVHIDVVLVTNR
ncbi:MAG: hypothetical protein GY927_21475 [bacterium]|nr:hypothetical protein [bacterium]